MSQQLGTSRLPVALATFFLVAAVGAFGASFYIYDGVALVADYVDSAFSVGTPEVAQPTTGTVDATRLVLPDGMPDEFALRLWQEQLDSQEMIGRLVSGEVKSLRVDRINRKGEDATLFVTVRSDDGEQISGAIALKQYSDDWYIAGVSALRGGEVSTPQSPLPKVEDVDIPLLNTMIAENKKSQSVIDEYLSGNVRQVVIEDINLGPKTATMAVEMEEGHGDGYANLVAIQEEIDGRAAWFLARFTKTGHNPPEL